MQDINQIYSLQTLRIHGDDAATFLQGQLTTDVTQLQNTWQLAGYCSPKGRLLAVMILCQDQNGFLAVLHKSVAETVSARLRMYVLRSNVVIEPLDAAMFHTMTPCGSFSEVGNTGEQPILCFGNFGLRVALESSEPEQNQDQNHSQADLNWELALIQAGIPNITAQTQELFVPQMVNLDQLGGINFKKGCYTGQEIVARMHYLGKLKQRMFVCSTPGNQTGIAGTKIITQGGKSAGTLASNIVAGWCLAVLRLEHCESELQLEDGSALVIGAHQPYSIETPS